MREAIARANMFAYSVTVWNVRKIFYSYVFFSWKNFLFLRQALIARCVLEHIIILSFQKIFFTYKNKNDIFF